MNRKILERIIESHILELFPGAEIREGEGNPKQRKYAVYSRGRSEIRIKEIDGTSFYVTRSQPFTDQELKIIHDIIEIADEYSQLSLNTQIYLNSNSLSRTVARSLVNDNDGSDLETLISLVIDTLEKWSAQTYEGNRISISIGIDPDLSGKENEFETYISEDFSRVLTNGYDTIIEFSKSGGLVSYSGLSEQRSHIRAPFRYTAFCNYTDGNQKYAFVLNRNGEILIFRSGELVFAKRRGDWRLFTHQSVQKQMAFGSRKTIEKLQNAIYESALDVSFARCGGCIGSVQKNMFSNLKKDMLIKESDLFATGSDPKTKALRSFFPNVPFHEMDRRIRQEILGIDGATIIDWDGNIVAVGAILNISQKDTIAAGGGARLAAAKSLRKYGYSIKISTDGEIKAFGKSSEFRFG